MVGLIMVVIVLSTLMALATSNTLMLRTEVMGESARRNYKRAHYAAIAGIHFIISRLRSNTDPTWTTASRLFFTFDAGCSTTHHYKVFAGGSGAVGYSGYTNVKGKETFASTHTFTNTDVSPSDFRFIVCTYPGVTPATDYWVKSQGIAIDGDRIYNVQVWAFLEINNTSKTVVLKKWGSMPVQPVDSIVTGTVINDFWDWQDAFY